MGQPIKRSTLVSICDWWNGKNGGGRELTQEEKATQIINSQTFFGVYQPELITLDPPRIMPEDYLFPRSFYPPTISYANAVKQIYRNKLKVVVDLTSAYVAGDNPIVALTPAKVGRICQFKSLGDLLYFGNIAIPDATQSYLYVDVNGTATNTEADAFADLLFMTGVSNGYAVAMCEKIPAGGLSLEEVDDEIDAKFTAAKKTTNVSTGLTLSIDNDGALVFTGSSVGLKYYGYN